MVGCVADVDVAVVQLGVGHLFPLKVHLFPSALISIAVNS